jgi:hypothetical protein
MINNDTVTSIGDPAFAGASIASVNIPASVKSDAQQKSRSPYCNFCACSLCAPTVAYQTPAARSVVKLVLVDISIKSSIFLVVKGLLAIVFSVALLLSQTAFMTGAGDLGSQGGTIPKCCCHCQNCKGGACCLAKNGPGSSHPVPAVPSHGVSQNDWQIVAAITVHFLPQATAKPLACSSSFQFCPSVTAPLYQRNCSYLI